jgi:hypothetical protein
LLRLDLIFVAFDLIFAFGLDFVVFDLDFVGFDLDVVFGVVFVFLFLAFSESV